jgi:colicin import membrane protein
MEPLDEKVRAFVYSLLLHGGIGLFMLLGFLHLPPRAPDAAGEPVLATMRVSSADLKSARAAIAKATKQMDEDASPKRQPLPAPRPQQSPAPLQVKAQERIAQPDTTDQQAVSRLSTQPALVPEPQEQQARHQQEQVDLTQDIEHQQDAEHRQRLQELQDIQRLRLAAERRTKMEEQRLQQLADLAQHPDAVPAAADSPAPAGNHGVDAGLLARYKAAMLQTADQNWNHVGAPELSSCRVRFTQIPGGEIINVEFMRCPYDAQGREFVERALKKAPMPYAGFEPVFIRQVELTFCYPREECEQ